jgi:hypothetical protein
MRRLFIAIAILLAACGPAFPQKAVQAIPSKKELSEIINQQLSHRSLIAKDAPPFHLVANIRYVLGETTKTGSYDLYWAAPDRFHEEFVLEKLTETDVAVDGKRYIVRDTKFMTYHLWWVRSLLDLPSKPLWATPEERLSVRSIKPTAANQLSVKLSNNNREITVGVNAADNRIISEEVIMGEWKPKPTTLTDEYVDFGTTRYPKHVVRTWAQETFEISVTKLEPANSLAEAIFAIPTDAATSDWCADPAVSNAPFSFTKFTAVTGLSFPDANIWNVPVDRIVAANGHIEKKAYLLPNGAAKEIEPAGKSKGQSTFFGIVKCSGKPIEYEYVATDPLLP